MTAGEANIWQPRTIIQVSADTKRVTQRFTAVANQTLFIITDFAYTLGVGSLEVYRQNSDITIIGKRFLTPGVEFVEQTETSFSIVTPAVAGEQIVAVGYVAIEGTVDVRDTDIFVTNYQAIRDYTGTEITLYSQGKATVGDAGEGFFQKITGQAPGFFVDNNIDIIVPTGGNGSEAWVNTQLAINIKFWGAKGDGVTDDTSAWDAAIINIRAVGGGTIFFPEGTYLLSDIDEEGLENLVVQGVGPNSILDFKGSTSTAALRLGWSLANGGCKDIKIENIAIQDSSVLSSCSRLIELSGGMAGNSPSTTSGFIVLDNVIVEQYNNPAGVILYIDGVSHLGLYSSHQAFDIGGQYGLFITNTEDVNTGVCSFYNSSFRGLETAVYFLADAQLIDSYVFSSCGMFNIDTSAARSVLRLRGQNSTLAGVSFAGCHLEARSNDTAGSQSAIEIQGNVATCSFVSTHISAGAATSPQADFGVRFMIDPTSSNSNLNAITFESTEFLRVSSSGFCFRFDNDITTSPSSPISTGMIWKNTTGPDNLEIESGVNEQNILRSIKSVPAASEISTSSAALLNLEDSATPAVDGGNVFQFIDTLANTTITDFITEYVGQVIIVINNSDADVTIENDFFKIRLRDSIDRVLVGGDSISFLRSNSGDTHWTELFSTSLSAQYTDESSITTASTRTVLDARVKANSLILLSASDANCATAMGSSKSLFPTNKVVGVSFDVNTADATNVVGFCGFTYQIINP